mmetsp:Transcript_6537/g.17067  ORF Transcript_6537/g.17067 Transcript_6537/m.17067 type:complete len:226 (-) Transcript_6537:316-993(-)
MTDPFQRIVQVCTFKDWDLVLEHKRCTRSKQRRTIIGDVLVKDKKTKEILLCAHDVNSSKRLVVKTCCEKLLCRPEIRVAEIEYKQYSKVQKKHALQYLNEAFSSDPMLGRANDGDAGAKVAVLDKRSAVRMTKKVDDHTIDLTSGVEEAKATGCDYDCDFSSSGDSGPSSRDASDSSVSSITFTNDGVSPKSDQGLPNIAAEYERLPSMAKDRLRSLLVSAGGN